MSRPRNNANGSTLVLVLLVLPLFIIAIHLARSMTHKDQTQLLRHHSNDRIMKRVAIEFTECLNQIGKLNQELKILHLTLTGLIAASLLQPELVVQVERTAKLIQVTGKLAQASKMQCALKQFPRDSGDAVSSAPAPKILVDLTPWSLWWNGFQMERSPVMGLPYRLVRADVKSGRQLKLRAFDQIQFQSSATAIISSSPIKKSSWRFGG